MATRVLRTVLRVAAITAIVTAGVASSARPVRADALLDEIVGFTGQIFIIDTKVPAVVIAAIRDGETSVRGFGERAGEGSPPPDGDTILRLGSITKAFTGEMLAHLTADGTVELTQPLAKWAPDLAAGASSDAQRIRLIDLATHAGGLPREVPHEPGPDDDPFATITREAGERVGPFVVVGVPGKSPGEVAFHCPQRRRLVIGDAVIGNPPGTLSLLREKVMDDPAQLRASIRTLAELDFDVLLTGDGVPILRDARARLRELVASFPT
jgi:Beta-lactamase/Metallo-beta-lactamase superfamily